MELFDLTKEQYNLFHRAEKLRAKIKARTVELGIKPEHTKIGHFYRYEDKLYTSVTGRLQILKDPSLANWKMNRACEHIRDSLMNKRADNLIDINKLIEQAKLLPQTEFQAAGSIGTQVHDWRERVFQQVIDGADWETAFAVTSNIPPSPSVVSGCRAIQKFVKEHNYIPVACELYVADHKLETGGAVDDIGYVDGELALVDLKTSNQGWKTGYAAQTCLYYYMFKKLYGIRPKKVFILHASKVNGTYELIEIKNIPQTVRWAQRIIDVDKGIGLLKDDRKKEYISI